MKRKAKRGFGIIGSADDSLVRHLSKTAKTRGLLTECYPFAELATTASTLRHPGSADFGGRTLEWDSYLVRRVPGPTILAVPRGVGLSEALARRAVIAAAALAWLDSLEANGAALMSSPSRVFAFDTKVTQHPHLERMGLRLPRTIFSNDPVAIREFAEALGGEVVMKSVLGGTPALLVRAKSFARFKRVLPVHMVIQEVIRGDAIRVTLVADRIVDAVMISSDTLDYRMSANYRLKRPAVVPVTVPKQVAKECVRAAHSMGQILSGVDIVRTAAGEWVFLEFNPMPIFMWRDTLQKSAPTANAIIDWLMTTR